MFAAGNLAMTAEDLAKWDLSVIDQTLLKAGSYHEMETEGRLNNGAGTLYGLGIGVSIENGHRVLGHGGEVMGFTAYNGIYPDDRMAIVVLTNQDAVGAYGTIAKRISSALLESKDEVSESRLALTKKIFIEPVA
jgi:CubicO group peptidase (beta-lactamase class C family)